MLRPNVPQLASCGAYRQLAAAAQRAIDRRRLFPKARLFQSLVDSGLSKTFYALCNLDVQISIAWLFDSASR